MTIKNRKNWLLKHYFIPVITIYGITYLKYVYPIKSISDLVRKIVICLITILLAAIGVKLLEKLSRKSFTVTEDCLIIKSGALSHKYKYDYINNVKYEKMKRTRSGKYGSQLNLYVGKRQYIIDSVEFENLEQFVKCLNEKVPVEFI